MTSEILAPSFRGARRANPESGDELSNIEVPGSLAMRAPRNDRETKMLFTADHDDVRRSLQKFIATEINPFVDEWEEAIGGGADEVMLMVLCKMMGTLPGLKQK